MDGSSSSATPPFSPPLHFEQRLLKPSQYSITGNKKQKQIQQSNIDALGVKSDDKKVGRPVVPEPNLTRSANFKKSTLPKAKKKKFSRFFDTFKKQVSKTQARKYGFLSPPQAPILY